MPYMRFKIRINKDDSMLFNQTLLKVIEKQEEKMTFKQWLDHPDRKFMIEYHSFLHEYLQGFNLTDIDIEQIYEVYKDWPRDKHKQLSNLIIDWFASDDYTRSSD